MRASSNCTRKMAKATLVAVLLVVVLVKNALEYQTSDKAGRKTQAGRQSSMSQNKMYEYCIKIIMVCYLIWDMPPDYEDDEDNLEMGHPASSVHNKYTLSIIDEEFRKAKCIPEKLSTQELNRFWQDVRRWQAEVEKQFLATNIFVVGDELDGGKAIRINLWSVFKIRMTVICNRTKDFDIEDKKPTQQSPNLTTPTLGKDPATTTKPTEVSCDESDPLALWINEQIKGANIFETFLQRLPKIIDKLGIQINRDCCPYAILRDRIETINDKFDTIMQLRSIEHYERAESSGYAWLDFQNLMVRLEYVNQKNKLNSRSSGKCCENYEQELKDTKHNFKMKRKALEKDSSSNIIYQNLSKNQQRINQHTDQYLKHLLLEDNPLITAANPAEKCCHSPALNEIEKLINYLNSADFKLTLREDLYEKLANANTAIQNSRNLIIDEERKVNDLNTMCTQQCLTRNETNLSLNEEALGKEKNLASKLKDFEGISLSQLNETLSKGYERLEVIKKKLNSFLANESFSTDNSQLPVDSSENSVLKDCEKSVKGLSENLEKLTIICETNRNSQNNIKLTTDALLKALEALLNKFLSDSSSSPKLNIEKKKEIGNIERLERLMEEIIPISRNSSEAASKQSKQLAELELGIVQNLTGNLEMIKASNLENQQSIKLNSSEKNPTLSPFYSANRLQNLETRFENMLKQSKDLEKRMLQKIDELQKRLKAVNENIGKTRVKAEECSVACDANKFPSIENLKSRLNELDTKSKRN